MQKFRVGQTIKFRRSNMEVCKGVIIDRRLSTDEFRVSYIADGKELGICIFGRFVWSGLN